MTRRPATTTTPAFKDESGAGCSQEREDADETGPAVLPSCQPDTAKIDHLTLGEDFRKTRSAGWPAERKAMVDRRCGNHGRVEQFGTPEDLVQNPATAFVATFVGTPPANLIPVPSLPPSLAANLPAEASAMYRPEDLSVSATPLDGSLAFDFAEASPVAGRTMLTGTRGTLRITAVVDAAPRFSVGDSIHFVLPPAPAALFGANGELVS